MKIAIFLDVDKTITKHNIQEIYAYELGSTAAYRKIEDDFQLRTIDAVEFGNKLIQIFAEKRFSKTMAEEILNKVELRDGVDKLFSFQKKGVDIFLVSSGPNYYVDVLGQRKKIPADRILSSKYFFDDDGIIYKCHAVEDQDKVKFVVNNVGIYDITIGIGDNDRHDKFVDVCTIAMFVEPNENYIHVPHLNAVCTLIESLLRMPNADSKNFELNGIITLDDFKPVNLKTALSRVSVGLWSAIGGVVVGAFTLGFSATWLKSLVR